MAIEITARDKEIPAAALDYARGRAADIEKGFEKVSQVRAVLDTGRHLYKAQFTATVVGENFAAEAEDAESFVKAVDAAYDRLHAQIRRRRDIVGDNRKA
ncbi:MAG: HPF/RaiA family ribosome-associated protein [Kiritimatiellae bacterium]|nr:HPF/RaiA family ribosome-associated protein [Kiritimatiellia bacterium]